jgi:hypothetical protein
VPRATLGGRACIRNKTLSPPVSHTRIGSCFALCIFYCRPSSDACGASAFPKSKANNFKLALRNAALEKFPLAVGDLNERFSHTMLSCFFGSWLENSHTSLFATSLIKFPRNMKKLSERTIYFVWCWALAPHHLSCRNSSRFGPRQSTKSESLIQRTMQV